jgi:hypothetical protein
MAETKRVTGDYTIKTLGAGSQVIIDSDLIVTGDVNFEDVKNRVYVAKSGDDDQDGLSWAKAKRTIKAACALAQQLIDNEDAEANHVAIMIASGDYTEDCPITVPPGCAIIGDNLRSVTVRPSVSTSNVFYLNSNCYAWGITVRGHRLNPSALDITPEGYAGYNGQDLPRSTKQTGFAFSFAPGAIIRVSPYIQNCSSISGSGVFGNPDYVPGGGGILVDPSICAEGNRVNSIVLDAFTQINQGGIGCKVVGRGYMQLVSFFVNFCQFGILCVDGGHVTLLNSNCSFGNYAFWSEGQRTLVREPDEELDSEDLQGLVLATASDTFSSDDTILCDTVESLEVNLPIRFSIPASDSPAMIGGLIQDKLYYIKTINSDNNKITLSESPGGSVVALSDDSSGEMTIRYAHEEVRPYESARTVLQNNRRIYQDATSSWLDSEIATSYSSNCSSSDTTDDYITCDSTSWMVVGTAVKFSDGTGSVFGGLTANTIYYVVDINGNDFKVSLTLDGNPVNLTTVPSGDMTVNFYYDSGSLKRDMGFIIDALIQDLLTDSVIYSRRIGTSYWDGVDSTIRGRQLQTVDAIAELENLILADLAGSDPAIIPIKSSLDNVSEFIINGPNRPFEDARNIIEGNVSAYQSGLIAYVNTTYPLLIYREDKCQRDVNYLVKSIISDLITGTGRASRTSGNAYYTGSVDIPLPDPVLVFDEDQKTPTVDAIEWLRDEIVNDVSGTFAGDSVTRYFDTITGIIQNGPDPDDLLLSPTYEPARILLDLNKEFIKSETVAYVNEELSLSTKVTGTTSVTNIITVISTRILSAGTLVRFSDDIGGLTAGTDYYVLPGLTSTTFQVSTTPGGSPEVLADDAIPVFCIIYDQDRFRRDMGYIVDAVISDLTTNSQESTLMVGNSYWRGAASISQAFVSQIPDTLSAIDYAKRLALKVIASDITPPIGSPELLEPRDIFFKDDGTKLYILGGVGPRVYQFELSNAWDTTDLIFEGSFNLSDQEVTPQGMYIGDSGSSLYIVGTGTIDDENDGRTVYQYTLSTPWDITDTVAYNNFYSLSDVSAPSAISFSDSGDKMFIVDNTGAAVYRYSLVTDWDIATAGMTYDQSYPIADDNLPTGIYFKSGGDDLYITGTTNDIVIHYSLASSYDLTTISLVETISVTAQETEVTGLSFKDDGSKLYIIGLNSDSVNSYDLLTNWDISSFEFMSSTPVGYYSTPYQTQETQQFISLVTGTDTDSNILTCDSTFYFKVNDPVKFVDVSGGSIFGGVVAETIYYIKEIISSTEFTVSETLGGTVYAGITTDSGTMAVAPSDAGSVGAGYEIEKFFNTIISIIRNGAREKEEEFGSLVEATGYTLSYAGAGIDYTKLSPGQGGTGVTDPNKYTIELAGGRVFITATDEQGDFYVGKIAPSAAGENARPLFRINQASGAIDGRAFYQSIFGFLAPFILALTRRK